MTRRMAAITGRYLRNMLLAFLGLIVLWDALVPAFWRALPPGLVLDIRSFDVASDGTVTMRRALPMGTRQARVTRELYSGGVTVCQSDAVVTLEAERDVSRASLMDWLPGCALMPGSEYVLDATLTVLLPGNVARQFRTASPPFSLTDGG